MPLLIGAKGILVGENPMDLGLFQILGQPVLTGWVQRFLMLFSGLAGPDFEG